MLESAGIGHVQSWFVTTGAEVNAFARQRGVVADERNLFPDDLTILLFSGMAAAGPRMGKLAMLKLQLGDRWFDDVIDNMVVRAGDEDEEN